MPEPNSVPAFLSIFSQQPAEKTPSELEMERAFSASEGSETVKASSVELSEKSATATLKELSSTRSKKGQARFVEPLKKKSSRMGTLRRLTKKYSKKCKEANLRHLLNWKSENWNRVKGLEGEVLDTKLSNIELPSGEKCENYLHQIIDKEFPETIRDCFTKSLFKYKYDEKLGTFKKTPELIEEVFTEGNTVQMWKLLDKKGVNWHVSCVIWHNEEPYSFGFDGNFIHETDKVPNLAMKTPNLYLEVALARQISKPSSKKANKFVELLAMGVLDKHMVTQLLRMCGKKTNRYTGLQFKSIFSGFEDVDAETKSVYKTHSAELVDARGQWIKHITEKGQQIEQTRMGKKLKLKTEAPENFSYNATVLIPILIDTFDKKPFQLHFSSIVMTFDDFEYCRKDPGRKSSKKNCMGGLDSLFQDLFSCRLFGTYIHPKLCGPKKSCFSGEISTLVRESESEIDSTSVRHNRTELPSVPNSVRKLVGTQKVSRAGNTSSRNGPRYRTAVLGRKKRKNGNKPNTRLNKKNKKKRTQKGGSEIHLINGLTSELRTQLNSRLTIEQIKAYLEEIKNPDEDTGLHNAVRELSPLFNLDEARDKFNDSVINLPDKVEERISEYEKLLEAYKEAISDLGYKVEIKPPEAIGTPSIKDISQDQEGISSYISTLNFTDANTPNFKGLTPIDLFNIKLVLINKLLPESTLTNSLSSEYTEFRKKTKFVYVKRIIHQLYSATAYSEERETFITTFDSLKSFYMESNPKIHIFNQGRKRSVYPDGFKRKSPPE